MSLRPLAVLLALVTAAGCSDDPPTFADAGPTPDAPLADAAPDPDAAPGPDASDGAPPDTTIVTGPPTVVTAATATFTFEATEPGTFRCALDDGEAAPCTSPHTITVGDGAHSLTVTAVDEAGNPDPTPAVHDWTVDTTPPDTTITEAPPAADNAVDTRFAFASEDGARFECALDGAPLAACTSPHPVTGLVDGGHTFTVRAIDAAGLPDPSPASHAWTVDASTPDTRIDSGPDGTVASRSATLAFSSPDAGAGATFECSLDGARFAACTSPRTLADLDDGEHTFRVRVRDATGNTDPSPASRVWTVDVAPPVLTLTGPAGATPGGAVDDATPTFAFSAVDASAVSFRCRLDGAGPVACTAPHTTATLADGAHTFAVVVTDAAGLTDSAAIAFTVDTHDPLVTLAGPTGTIADRIPTFTFSASDTTATTLACRLDGAPVTPCTSPRTTASLADGDHTFAVTATDAVGRTGTASLAFTVDGTGPAVHFLRTPPAGWPLPVFRFELALVTPEAGASIECSLDDGGFAPCASSFVADVALETQHRLAIRGVDSLGNRGATVTTTWTPTAGLVLHYPLDRDSDNHSILAPDHPLVARPTFVGGYAGGAATLPEAGAITDSIVPLVAGTGYTIALWTLVPGVGGANLFDSRSDDGGCSLTVVRATVTLTCAAAGIGELGHVEAAITANQWVSVVVRYAARGAPVELWIDGAPAGVIPNPGGADVFSVRQRRNALVGPVPAPHRLDDVRVYNRTFSDAALCTDVLLGVFAGERCAVPRPGLELGFELLDPSDLASLVDTGIWDLTVVARAELAPERAVFGDGVVIASGGILRAGPMRLPLASAEDHTLSLWFRARDGRGFLVDLRCLASRGCDGQGGLGVQVAGEELVVCGATAATGERCTNVRFRPGEWTHLMITSDGRRSGRVVVTDRLVVHVDGQIQGTVDFGGEGNVFGNAADGLELPVDLPGIALDEVEVWPVDLSRSAETACHLGLGGELDGRGACALPPTP